MKREELLERLAMEVSEWPEYPDVASQPGLAEILPGREIRACWAPAMRPAEWMVSIADGEGITKQDWLAERERLINKPSWDDAPEWAQCLTQQPSGNWYWHQDPPVEDEGSFPLCGHFESAAIGEIPAGHDWRQTLEQRPVTWPSEERIDRIGQSGPTGCHYDAVNPDHYRVGGIEAIDYMKAKATPEEFRGHLRLTAIKYLSRAGHKDELLSEYRKARWYLDRLISELEATA